MVIKINMFNSDPSNRLSSFEDVIDAFEKFPEGGFWIKKIIQRMGIFRETVDGPYKKVEAEKIAERWRKVFKFEDKEVAHVLQFNDLICSPSPLEIGKYAWKPPRGSGLLCILHGFYPLIVYPVKGLEEDSSLNKFYNYTRPDGIRSQQVGDKMIFFNQYNVNSYRRKSAMKQFLENDTVGYDQEQIEWIIKKISGRNTDDLERPSLIPGYVVRLDWECSPVEMDFFKSLAEGGGKGKSHLSKSFNKLKKCAPEDNKSFFFHESVRFEVAETDLLIENKMLNFEKDEDITMEKIRKFMKRLAIEKGSHGKYNVILTNYEGNFSVGVYAIEKGVGRMIIHLPDEDFDHLSESESMFISRKLRKNKYFTRMDINGAILLYIVKCMGVNKVWLEDERTGACDCEASDVSSFINPVRFLADQPSIYANLGFRNKEQAKLDEIIEEYKVVNLPVTDPYSSPTSGRAGGGGEIDIGDGYDSSSSLESLTPSPSMGGEEEDEKETMNIADLAVMYLSKDCTYENLCDVMWVVTEDIYEKIPKKYELNLDEMSLEYYRGLF